jgi:hypothetical protein
MGIEKRNEADLVSVVVPEIVPTRWWEHMLHNKTALYIRTAFLFRPNVVVIAVPYQLGRSARLRELMYRDEDVFGAAKASADEAGRARPGSAASGS